MNEQIKGLLTCKPENTPHAGEVRKYVVTYPLSKRTNEPWTKIANSDDGTPYSVISVARTDYQSDRGYVSFNLVIEPSQDAPPASQEAPPGHFNQLPHQSSQNPPKRVENLSKDDYWARKEDRDIASEERNREREARQVAQQPRIERQHSQAMALQLAAIFPYLVTDEVSEASVGHFNFGKLHSLITQFQEDIAYIPPEYPR